MVVISLKILRQVLWGSFEGHGERHCRLNDRWRERAASAALNVAAAGAVCAASAGIAAFDPPSWPIAGAAQSATAPNRQAAVNRRGAQPRPPRSDRRSSGTPSAKGTAGRGASCGPAAEPRIAERPGESDARPVGG
jgi:hypothetical protein